jgi:hypothetical protein
MNKLFISLSVVFVALSFSNCGPAAEDRFKMKETANHVSDSIGKAIDAALAQGAIPGTATNTIAPVDTTKK